MKVILEYNSQNQTEKWKALALTNFLFKNGLKYTIIRKISTKCMIQVSDKTAKTYEKLTQPPKQKESCEPTVPLK